MEPREIGMKSLIIVALVGIFIMAAVILYIAVVGAGLNRNWEKEDEEQEKVLANRNDKEK